MEISTFNQMSLPRTVLVKKSHFVKYFFLSIFTFCLLVFSVPYGFILSRDMKNFEVQKTWIKLLARIDKIETSTGGRSELMKKVTYSYDYLAQHYTSKALERYGVHQPGDLVTIYVSPSDPSQNRAEFVLGEKHQVFWSRVKEFGNLTLIVLASVLGMSGLLILASNYDRSRDKKIFGLGMMTTGEIKQILHGRSRGVEVEFQTMQGLTVLSELSYPFDREVKVGDTVQVVYLPEKPESARLFPSYFVDVQN